MNETASDRLETHMTAGDVEELRKALEMIRDFAPSGMDISPHTQIAIFAKDCARKALASKPLPPIDDVRARTLELLVAKGWELHRRALSYATAIPAANMLLAECGEFAKVAAETLSAQSPPPPSPVAPDHVLRTELERCRAWFEKRGFTVEAVDCAHALSAAPQPPSSGQGEGFKPCVGCEMPRTCTAVNHCYAAPPSSGEAEDVARMRRTLENIAKQNLSTEVPPEVRKHGDFEGAYDIIVGLARGALSPKADGGDHG